MQSQRNSIEESEKCRMGKKIIVAADTEELIRYSLKNLTTYQLVYKKKNQKLYSFAWIIAFLSLASLFMTLLLICAVTFFEMPDKESLILQIGFSSEGLALICVSLFLFVKRKNREALKTADLKRYELLDKYLREKQYSAQQIVLLNEQVKDRAEEKKKSNFMILVVWAALYMPLWQTLYGSLEQAENRAFFQLLPIIILFTSFMMFLFSILDRKLTFLMNHKYRQIMNINFTISQIVDHVKDKGTGDST
jgi:hypothetical protein